MRMNTVRPTCRGVAQPCVLINAGNNTVINQETVFRTHQPISAFADGQIAHHIGVKHIKEFARIRPLDNQFAQSRCIKQPQGFACLQDFTLNRLGTGF